MYYNIILIIALPQILLIATVAGLLVMAAAACIKSNRGPVSMVALKDGLTRLRRKLDTSSDIDPGQERQEMEVLQNSAKASCHQEMISRNKELKALFLGNCQCLGMVTARTDLSDRTSWVQLRELMCNFNDSYFQKNV